jgi:hypothetical protein
VAAAKPFVAAACLALLVTASALADSPTVRITAADQAKATAALLRRSDLGMGWLGGPVKPSPITPPDCPGFSPKESDLVVSGHAHAIYVFRQGGVELDQDVQVLTNDAAVRTDFDRSISPQLARCLAYQLGRVPGVSEVSVIRIPFPPVGTVSAAYRAEMVVTRHGHSIHWITDYVFFGQGRTEYELTVVAPAETSDQLSRFEVELAQSLLRRAGAEPA